MNNIQLDEWELKKLLKYVQDYLSYTQDVHKVNEAIKWEVLSIKIQETLEKEKYVRLRTSH